MVGLFLTLAGGWTLGYILFRFSKLDRKTAFFSFIPGGASEVLGLASKQGANVPIVATFHTARILLFVTILPFLAGNGGENPFPSSLVVDVILKIDDLIVMFCLVTVALTFNYLKSFPAGPLFYSTLLALIWNFGGAFEMPVLATGIGQMLIGVNIGLKFNRETFKTLKSIGVLGISSLLLMVSLSITVGYIFSMWTQVDFWSSVLGWAPAGAGEMSSTAILLKKDVSAVIMLQFIRLYTVFFSLPLVSLWLKKS